MTGKKKLQMALIVILGLFICYGLEILMLNWVEFPWNWWIAVPATLVYYVTVGIVWTRSK